MLYAFCIPKHHMDNNFANTIPAVGIPDSLRDSSVSAFWNIETNRGWSYMSDEPKFYMVGVLQKAILRAVESGDVYGEAITCDCVYPREAVTSEWHGSNKQHIKVFALIRTKEPVTGLDLRSHMVESFSSTKEVNERCEFNVMRFNAVTEGQFENLSELFKGTKFAVQGDKV